MKAWETSKVWQEQEQCDVAIQMVIRCVDRDVKGREERMGVRACHNTRVGVHVLLWSRA